MRKLIAGISLVCLSATAAAEFPVGKVGLSLSPSVDFSVDGLPEDADGNAIGFRGELGSDMLFGYVDHNMSNLEIQSVDLDVDETRFGVGLRGSNDTGTLEARVEQYDFDVDIAGSSDGEDGIGVHVGGALPIAQRAAVFGSYGLLSLDELDGDEIQLGLRSHNTDTLEVYGLFRMLSLEDGGDEAELDELRLGINLKF